MKIISLGSGFVSDHLNYEKITTRIQPDPVFISYLIDKHKPDVIVNCIGKTGRPNVDWCESNKEETANANVVIPTILAQECKRKNIHLVHIGSGCIFFGKSPNLTHEDSDSGWKEDDFANPQSFYSKTKYACDLAIGDMDHVTTLRIRMPISTKNNPRNLINKLKGYSKVIDIPNSMTFMDDLVRCIDWIIYNSYTGIYHVTNDEPITAAQIMKEYQKYVPDHKFEVIDEAGLLKLTSAKRSNCILNTDKLKNKGFHLTPSSEVVEKCMKEYIKNI